MIGGLWERIWVRLLFTAAVSAVMALSLPLLMVASVSLSRGVDNLLDFAGGNIHGDIVNFELRIVPFWLLAELIGFMRKRPVPLLSHALFIITFGLMLSVVFQVNLHGIWGYDTFSDITSHLGLARILVASLGVAALCALAYDVYAGKRQMARAESLLKDMF